MLGMGGLNEVGKGDEIGLLDQYPVEKSVFVHHVRLDHYPFTQL